jgi:hypothetical protein
MSGLVRTLSQYQGIFFVSFSIQRRLPLRCGRWLCKAPQMFPNACAGGLFTIPLGKEFGY